MLNCNRKHTENLERLCSGCQSLLFGELVQPLVYRLNVLLSTKLLEDLFCIGLSRKTQYLTEDGLTYLSLLNLPGHQRKGGEQLHKYLDNRHIHSNRRCDLGIDIEAPQKTFERLEQLNQ